MQVVPDLTGAPPLERARAMRWGAWNADGTLLHLGAMPPHWSGEDLVELSSTRDGYRFGVVGGEHLDVATAAEAGALRRLSPDVWLVILRDDAANRGADVIVRTPSLAYVAHLAYDEPAPEHEALVRDGRRLACAVREHRIPGYVVVDLDTGEQVFHPVVGRRLPELRYKDSHLIVTTLDGVG